jgi:hypothetical protein
MVRSKSCYTVVSTDLKSVTLRDDMGLVSVTNDAESVVREVFIKYGNRRILYYDSYGELGELIHNSGVFLDFGFSPLSITK